MSIIDSSERKISICKLQRSFNTIIAIQYPELCHTREIVQRIFGSACVDRWVLFWKFSVHGRRKHLRVGPMGFTWFWYIISINLLTQLETRNRFRVVSSKSVPIGRYGICFSFRSLWWKQHLIEAGGSEYHYYVWTLESPHPLHRPESYVFTRLLRAAI